MITAEEMLNLQVRLLQRALNAEAKLAKLEKQIEEKVEK